jgi:hypothetical protein
MEQRRGKVKEDELQMRLPATLLVWNRFVNGYGIDPAYAGTA